MKRLIHLLFLMENRFVFLLQCVLFPLLAFLSFFLSSEPVVQMIFWIALVCILVLRDVLEARLVRRETGLLKLLGVNFFLLFTARLISRILLVFLSAGLYAVLQVFILKRALLPGFLKFFLYLWCLNVCADFLVLFPGMLRSPQSLLRQV